MNQEQRLQEAAPTLLATCQWVAEIIQGGDRFETLEPWAKEVVERLNSAITEATGKKTTRRHRRSACH